MNKTTNLIIPNSYGPEDYLDEERTHAMNGIIMRMIKSKNNKDNQKNCPKIILDYTMFRIAPLSYSYLVIKCILNC